MRAEEFNNPKENFVEMFRKFLPLAIKIIGLKSLPKIVFEKEIDSPDQPTFGQYVNNEHILYVGLANRHPNDILRTLAHELVHYKQDVNHELNDMSGSTGSPEENEANALAGVVMRNFNKRYPEFLKSKPIVSESIEEVVLDEGIMDFISKAKDKFLRLKDALSDEWAQSKEMWKIVQKGDMANPREISFANSQFKDILRVVGLAAWYSLPIPGNTLLILTTEKLLNKVGMSIIPDKIRNQVLNVKNPNVAEDNATQYVAALYVDEFADGDHWYIKGTPDVIKRFVQLANSLEDEAVTGTEYEPGVGMMAKIHKDLGDDSIPQWKIVPATNLEQIKPITGASLRALMTADLSDGVGEFMSDFLWNLEEKGQALVHDGSEQSVSENFDKEAEAWRDWQLKMLPRKMEMLSKLVKGWVPSEEDHIAAIEAGYDAMRNTGDVKDAAKAIADTLKKIQHQKGVAENFADGRNPQDKGDSARHGIRKGMTIAQLKKIRSSDSASPRKKQLAHWQINMRQGRKK